MPSSEEEGGVGEEGEEEVEEREEAEEVVTIFLDVTRLKIEQIIGRKKWTNYD